MHESQIESFQEGLDSMPQLKSSQSEHFHHVASGFIDGVQLSDEPNYDTEVQLDRVANDEEGYAPIIDYVVAIHLGSRHPRVSMTPEAAVNLGRSLMLAGTAALRDKSNNLGFLAGPEVFL